MLDLVVRDARLQDGRILDIAVSHGRISAVAANVAADCATIDAGGRLVVPGFVETHLHLDRAGAVGH